MDAMTLIQAALAAPKTHRVTTTYADGRVRTFDTRSAGSAETYAVGERRKIGKSLIEPNTGAHVRIVSVDITPIAEGAL